MTVAVPTESIVVTGVPDPTKTIAFSTDAKVHPNPSNMARVASKSVSKGEKPPSGEFKIPDAVAYHLIGVSVAKHFLMKSKNATLLRLTYPHLALLATRERRTLPNTSILRLFPEISKQALPMKWRRIKKVESCSHKIGVQHDFFRVVSYAIENGLDKLWTEDPTKKEELFYVCEEEKKIYHEALTLTVSDFELISNYKPEEDPLMEERKRKGEERMLGLQEFRKKAHVGAEGDGKD